MADEEIDKGGTFFPDEYRRKFHTGSTVFDLCLNQYAEGQIISVFGKSGTGKSHFLLEAAGNFIAKYEGQCLVRYHDSENARAPEYAANFVPLDSDCFVFTDIDDDDDPQPRTIEQFETELAYYCDYAKENDCPVLIIMDSWDALSCNAELKRKPDETNTYKMDKAKLGLEMARKYAAPMGEAGVTLMLASHSRMSVGTPFTYEMKTGGSWLEYYPTQILKIKGGEGVANTRDGFKRAYGNWITVVPVKNRRQSPRPPVELFLMYDFGICDLTSCSRFVIDNNRAHKLWAPDSFKSTLKGAKRAKALEKASAEAGEAYIKRVWRMEQDEYDRELERVKAVTIQTWKEFEAAFAPRRRKYGKAIE
jgi:RecA/RadA recombinase